MNIKITSITLGGLLAAGSLFAMPVGQDQPAAPAQTPAPAQAAPPAHHTADPNRQLRVLSKKLALTGDQQSQILPILTDRAQQVAAIQADNTLSQKDRREKLKAVHADSDTKLRAALTDTQRQAYDQMEQDRKERTRTHRQTTTQ